MHVRKRAVSQTHWEHVSFMLGISSYLIGASLTMERSILGERTSGIATLLGMVGIGLIATSGVRLLRLKKAQKLVHQLRTRSLSLLHVLIKENGD
jgi:hypothetical protein